MRVRIVNDYRFPYNTIGIIEAKKFKDAGIDDVAVFVPNKQATFPVPLRNLQNL